MKDMKESEWLLLEHQKQAVDKFVILEVVVGYVVELQGLSESTFMAEDEEGPMTEPHWNDLPQYEGQQDRRPKVNDCVVSLEGERQLQGFSISHE